MAKTVVLNDETHTDISEIEVPTTTGTAKFKDEDEVVTPTGTKSISQNGNGIDVAAYAYVDVNVTEGGSSGGGLAWSTLTVGSDVSEYWSAGTSNTMNLDKCAAYLASKFSDGLYIVKYTGASVAASGQQHMRFGIVNVVNHAPVKNYGSNYQATHIFARDDSTNGFVFAIGSNYTVALNEGDVVYYALVTDLYEVAGDE